MKIWEPADTCGGHGHYKVRLHSEVLDNLDASEPGWKEVWRKPPRETEDEEEDE